MNEHIAKFIKSQTCASLCCVDAQGLPYCFNCFYAFDASNGLLIYKSATDVLHSTIIKENPPIAGTILPDKLKKMEVKGIQLEGIILSATHDLSANAAQTYYGQNPMALAMSGEIWTIQINHIKMTDNTLGFGKKISWTRE